MHTLDIVHMYVASCRVCRSVAPNSTDISTPARRNRGSHFPLPNLTPPAPVSCNRPQRYNARANNHPALRAMPATKTVALTFATEDGEQMQVEAEVGETILDIALDNDIDIEGT